MACSYTNETVSLLLFFQVITYVSHLSEPVEDNLGLVRRQFFQLSEKVPLPQNLRVLQHLVDQVHPASGGCPE